MVWYIDNFSQLGGAENVFGAMDILSILVLSTILCLIVAKIYKATHTGLSYSQSFVQTTIIFGVLVSMIMLIIGSNIARAFTLVGALSIVRFRNAIKETKDVGYIFFMMVIGMAVGTRFYLLAIIMTLFISALALGMHKFNVGSYKKNDEILKVKIPVDYKFENPFEYIFTKYLEKYQLLSVEGLDSQDYNEAVFLIRFKKGAEKRKNQFLSEISKTKEVMNAYIISPDYLLY